MKTLLVAFFLMSISVFSQDLKFEKPNYRKIEKNIKKKKSNLFYDSLMSRYIDADTTLSMEEKRHLYYGYIYHERYSPYSHSDYYDSLNLILQKEKQNKTELNKIKKFGDSILHENPFDLRAINLQLYALEKIGDKKLFDKKLIQFQTVIDAILSSGNGMSTKDAFYVIYISHEYDILEILGYEFGGTQSLQGHFDVLSLAENEAEIENLYFDISPSLNSLSNMFKEQD